MNRPLAVLLLAALLATRALAVGCGTEGVWVQVLGSGGSELDDRRAGPAYLVWIDDQARLLVGAGPGTSVRFDEAEADFASLEAMVLFNVTADAAADLAALVRSSYKARERPLPVLGPSGNEYAPSTTAFVDRLIGRNGAFPALADYLTYRNPGGYRIAPRDVPSTGQRAWSGFSSAHLRLAALPVHHGNVPALAWRVEAGGQSIVFTGSASNQKGTLARLAQGADMLVAHHAIPEGARGAIVDWQMRPSQIGRIADLANVRFLLLAHRTTRTMGRETQSRAYIAQQFDGTILFADDLDCWGL